MNRDNNSQTPLIMKLMLVWLTDLRVKHNKLQYVTSLKCVACKECYQLCKNHERRQKYNGGQQNSNILTEMLQTAKLFAYHNLMPII